MRSNLREMMDSFFLQHIGNQDEVYCTFKELDRFLTKIETMSKTELMAAMKTQN